MHSRATKTRIRHAARDCWLAARRACLSAVLPLPRGQLVEPIQRVAVLRLDRLGDMILTQPLFTALKSVPGVERTAFVCRAPLVGFAEQLADVDDVIGVTTDVDAVVALQNLRADTVIDPLLDYHLRTARLAYRSGIRNRLGFSSAGRERYFTIAVKPPRTPQPFLKELAQLAASFKVTIETAPTLKPCAPSEEKTDVMIHPGANYPSQLWPIERFAEVAARLTGDGLAVLVITGPGEDRLGAAIIKRAPGCEWLENPPAGNWLPRLKATRVFLCNNSGPLHFAAAAGCGTVSTLGPTVAERWRPVGEHHIVLEVRLPCRPCSRGECRTHECMRLITVDTVLDAVRSQLANA